MSYASGGLIAAGDYNGFVGTSPGSGANQINTIWAVGSGYTGYGQTAISQVSSTGLVTATQWATALNALDNIRTHQTNSGASNIALPTSGSLITYLSTVSSTISTAYSNALTFGSQGSTVTGAVFSPSVTAANAMVAETFSITRTATFASADKARYFFNAGGQLNLVITGATNNDGTSRSGDLVSLLTGNIGGLTAFRANTNGGRTGSGGTSVTNAIGVGYYGLTTANTTIVQATSTTSGYTSDYANILVKTNGVQGTNNDNGSVLSFAIGLYSASRPALPAPPANPPGTGTTVNNPTGIDTINVTVNHRIDVVYPETTSLSNVWGAVSIT